jgi:hypothetical protein
MMSDTEEDLPRLEQQYSDTLKNLHDLENRIRRIKEIAASNYRKQFFQWLEKKAGGKDAE